MRGEPGNSWTAAGGGLQTYKLSEWWKQVLDYADVEDDPNEPGHEECMILSRDGSHRLLFIEVRKPRR